MVNANFESIFAPYLMNFIAYKQSCGYKYKTETTILKQFDKMCCSLNISEVALTKEIIDKWSSKKPYEKNRSSYQKRLSCVRQFALYMQSAGYKAYIPVNLSHICQRKTEYAVYIFSHDEMQRIFNESNNIYPNRRSTMHLVMPVLIRLLYSTGLRIMEALDLQLKNVDLINGTLKIENAKNSKDRLVPVSDSMTDILKQYCKVMHPAFDPDDHLFIGISRKKCSHHIVYIRFRELLVQAGIQHAGRGFGPRIHDLRHTFCCHTLQNAVSNGAELTNMLTYLSVYLGHESLQATSRYLRLTAEVYPNLADTVEKVCTDVIPEVKV